MLGYGASPSALRGGDLIGNRPGFVVGAAVHAVSRSVGKLDIYATSTTGEISGAAWEPDIAGDAGMPTGWRGWWHLVNGTSVAGAAVTVATRSADKVDVFVVGSDGVVYTASWEPSAPKWTAWRPIPGISALAGSPVGCVSRSVDQLDIFVTDATGRVQTSGWQPSFGPKWADWRQVAGGVVSPGAPVTAVSRSADHIDIFVTDGAGAVQTSAWEPSFGATWSGWRQVAGGVASPGAPVAAVSRVLDHIDVFVIANDGRVQTAAWEPSFGVNWRGWWPVG